MGQRLPLNSSSSESPPVLLTLRVDFNALALLTRAGTGFVQGEGEKGVYGKTINIYSPSQSLYHNLDPCHPTLSLSLMIQLKIFYVSLSNISISASKIDLI